MADTAIPQQQIDPELKALLRGVPRGSEEYRKIIQKYNSDKAAMEAQRTALAAEQERARIELEARNAREAKATADAAALKAAEQKAAEEAARLAAQKKADADAAMLTAESAGGGLVAGLLGTKVADWMANAKHAKEMQARIDALKPLAESARAIDPTAPNARGIYGDIAAAAKSGRAGKLPVPWGTGGLAAALAGLGAYSTLHRAPEAKTADEKALWTGGGYAEGAAGAKMAADSFRRYRNPGLSYPLEDIAAIEGAKRMAAGGELGPVAPLAPEPKGVPEPTAAPVEPAPVKPDYGAMSHRERQAAYRAAFGTKTAPNVTSDELRRALEIGKPITKKAISAKLLSALLPAGVAMDVYDSMTSPASAADGDSPDGVTWADRGRAAAVASGAGGAAYGLQRGAGWLGGKIGQAASYIPGASAVGAAASRALPWTLPAQVSLSSNDTQSPYDDSEEGRAEALRANRSLTAADLSPDEAVNEMAYQLQARPNDRMALVRALLGASNRVPVNADTMTAAEMGAF